MLFTLVLTQTITSIAKRSLKKWCPDSYLCNFYLQLFLLFHPDNGNGEKPIDYSLKKARLVESEENDCGHSEVSTSSTTSNDRGFVNLSTLPVDDLSDKILQTKTDGRSKRRKIGNSTTTEASKFHCHECGKHYATSSNLSRHKQTHRSVDSTQAKKCPHCSKVYVSMPAYSMHVLTHQLTHSCTVCKKAFSRPWLLQGHMRSHTGERPYACSYCSKTFADRSNLRAHTQTHAEDKDFRCGRCSKTFAIKSYLTKHLESSCQHGNIETSESEERD